MHKGSRASRNPRSGAHSLIVNLKKCVNYEQIYCHPTGLLPNSEPDVFVNADGALNVVLVLPNNPPDVVFAPNIFVCPDCPNIPPPVLVPNPPD